MAYLFSRGWRVRVAVALLLAASARAGDKERVPGKGYATTNVPALTDDPPAKLVEDQRSYDPEEGVVYDDPRYYDLRHGVEADDKQAWSATDFIKWKVKAATLVAWGQIHDADPKDAGVVKSKVWGAEKVGVRVARTEGKYGSISADNTISFEYLYTISGNHIGEASVQLQGHAFDIKGKKHSFDLSDQRSESVGSEENKKTGFEKRSYGNLKGFYSASSKGSKAGVAAEVGKEKREHEQIEASVSRRFGTAGGDNATTPQLTIRDQVSGVTELLRKYEIYSDGMVVLRARAGKVPEGTEACTVVVVLEKFKVGNQLVVFKQASDEWPIPDPLTIDSEDPPTTPSDGGAAGGGDGGGGDGGGAGESDDDCGGIIDGMGCVLFAPWGLSGELGTVPGSLRVTLRENAPTDIVLEVSASPAELVELGDGNRLLIPAGERSTSLLFHGAAPGDVVFRLADSAEVLGECTLRSVGQIPDTRIWAGWPARAGEGLTLHALLGYDLEPLAVGRLGFAGLGEETTTIQLAVEDPLGVLGPLPAAVTVPAGGIGVDLPLTLRDVEGTAALVLEHGQDRVEVTVVARAQEWSSAPVVTVPVGAVAPIPVLLRHPAPEERWVEATIGDAALGSVDEPGGRASVWPGETAWYLRLRGASLGRTTVTLDSNGLDPLEVPVEVVPSTVSFEDGALRLTDLPAAAEGTIEIWVPDELRISALELPPGAEEYLTVSGLGSSGVVLRFVPSPDMPSQLVIPMQLDGEGTSGGIELGIFDRLWSADSGELRNSYSIEVR